MVTTSASATVPAVMTGPPAAVPATIAPRLTGSRTADLDRSNWPGPTTHFEFLRWIEVGLQEHFDAP